MDFPHNFLLLMIEGLSDVLNDENSQRNFVCQKKRQNV